MTGNFCGLQKNPCNFFRPVMPRRRIPVAGMSESKDETAALFQKAPSRNTASIFRSVSHCSRTAGGRVFSAALFPVFLPVSCLRAHFTERNPASAKIKLRPSVRLKLGKRERGLRIIAVFRKTARNSEFSVRQTHVIPGPDQPHGFLFLFSRSSTALTRDSSDPRRRPPFSQPAG